MNSTATLTVQDQIARLRQEAEEAKGRGEFEYAFMLLDRVQRLEDQCQD